MAFVEVREPYTNKLLFRYDPCRDLVEIARRGIITVIDLQKLKPLPGTIRIIQTPPSYSTSGSSTGGIPLTA